MEDFQSGSLVPQRKQIRALKTIEKDEEIVINFKNIVDNDFHYGSREYRRQDLLETEGFLCQCSECSLEGEVLEENERMRAEIREKEAEIDQLTRCGLSGQGRGSKMKMKKAMKLVQEKVDIVKKMDIREVIVCSLFFQYGPANFSNIGSPRFPIWFH